METTHIETTRTGSCQVTIVRTPVESMDMLHGRWMDSVGRSQVVSAVHIEIRRTSIFQGVPSMNPYIEKGFEVTFSNGLKGYVTNYLDGQELNALQVSESHVVIHGLAVWRKHRHLVGSPTPWVRALRGRRGFIKPENTKVCKKACAAELYARAAGKPWGLG